jgi:cell division cycle protein 20 (cofactor of APC complex)
MNTAVLLLPYVLQLAIALGPTVYLYNATTGSIEELCSCPAEGEYVTSVSWAADASHLAIGTSSAKVQVWDAARCKQVKELAGHSNRVSSLAWNNAILSSGETDRWTIVRRFAEHCRTHLLR